MSKSPALLPEEVDDLLKIQSKNTRRKACYPCHQRKVGCDGGRPCQRCINREHPDLCSYEPGQPRTKKRRTEGPEASTAACEPLPTTIVSSQLSGSTREEGSEISSSCAPNVPSATRPSRQSLMATPVARQDGVESAGARSEDFLGSSSVPGFILDGVSPADAERLGTNHGELRSLLLPALGLQRTGSGAKIERTQQPSFVMRALDLALHGSEVIKSVETWHRDGYPKYMLADMNVGCFNNTKIQSFL